MMMLSERAVYKKEKKTQATLQQVTVWLAALADYGRGENTAIRPPSLCSIQANLI